MKKNHNNYTPSIFETVLSRDLFNYTPKYHTPQQWKGTITEIQKMDIHGSTLIDINIRLDEVIHEIETTHGKYTNPEMIEVIYLKNIALQSLLN